MASIRRVKATAPGGFRGSEEGAEEIVVVQWSIVIVIVGGASRSHFWLKMLPEGPPKMTYDN
jgi:hypothetical protein